MNEEQLNNALSVLEKHATVLISELAIPPPGDFDCSTWFHNNYEIFFEVREYVEENLSLEEIGVVSVTGGGSPIGNKDASEKEGYEGTQLFKVWGHRYQTPERSGYGQLVVLATTALIARIYDKMRGSSRFIKPN